MPQGSFEAQASKKSHVRIAVFSILAIHVVVLGGLLILGCKREDKDASLNTPPPANTDPVTPPLMTDPGVVSPLTSNTPPISDLGAHPSNSLPPTIIPPVPAPSNVVVIPPPFTPPPTTPVGGDGLTTTDHKIVKGDLLDTLARKYGVSAKAIQAANPTLVPTRMKVGDVIKIPAKSATAPSAANNGRTAAPAASGHETYTVKAGDNLSKIAKAHKTTIKELQKLNNLTTTQIKVSQKLKVPSHSAPAPVVVTPPVDTTPPPAVPPTLPPTGGGAVPPPVLTPPPAQ